jgi:preprotein translocase subunit YajC
MGAVAHLSDSTVSVEPGRTVTIKLTVRNNGTVVDRYTFEGLGAPAPWVSFNPTHLSLLPEAEGSVNVVLSPPREPTTTAGPTALGIRVTSSEDPAGSTVEEATVDVGAFSDIAIELVPHTPTGRFTAWARAAVDNRSNCDFRGDFSGSDPRTLLRFSFRPTSIEVKPGNAVFAKLAIRPARRLWRGSQQTHAFRVTLRDSQAPAEPSPSAASASGQRPLGGSPLAPAPRPPSAAVGTSSPHKPEVYSNGSMLQEPILPRWLMAVAAVLVALVLLWFALLKPQIRSAAQAQVAKQLAQQASSATTGPALASAQAVDNGVQATGNGTFLVLAVPDNKYLEITDLLVQNPTGDTGTLSLADNGNPLMTWSMADFRDLDYHWITPTRFPPGSKVQLTVSACGGNPACTPAVYYAGLFVPATKG